jgi:hypothetical protein
VTGVTIVTTKGASLESLRDKASRVSVDYGESRSVDLRLIER